MLWYNASDQHTIHGMGEDILMNSKDAMRELELMLKDAQDIRNLSVRLAKMTNSCEVCLEITGKTIAR